MVTQETKPAIGGSNGTGHLEGLGGKVEIDKRLPLTVFLEDERARDVALTGGKGASLAILNSIPGVKVPEAFIITTSLSNQLAEENPEINKEIEGLDDMSVGWIEAKMIKDEISAKESETQIKRRGALLGGLIGQLTLPPEAEVEILNAYGILCDTTGEKDVASAVRSSGKSEDGKDKSSAGQYVSPLNRRGPSQVLKAINACLSSQFTDRVIVYRNEARLEMAEKALRKHGDLEKALEESKKFSHKEAEMAVVVQRMIESSVSGTGFTRDPVTGEDAICIDFNYGIGESVVGGEATPDSFRVNPKTFEIIDRRLGKKKVKTIYVVDGGTETVPVSEEDQGKYCVSDEEVIDTAKMLSNIKAAYGADKDVEFAYDPKRVRYVTQARDVTTGLEEDVNMVINRRKIIKEEALSDAEIILEGGITGARGVASGKKLFARTVGEAEKKLETDEYMNKDVILVTDMTSPDWVPIMKKVRGMLIRHGGRTCHAAIVSRELRVPALVGVEDAIDILMDDGGYITMDADKMKVYDGELSLGELGEDFDVREMIDKPTKTKIKVNILFPEESDRLKALAKLGEKFGVGLVRAEFSFRELEHHLNSLVDFENNIFRFANDKDPKRRELEREAKRQIAETLKKFGYQSAREFVVDQHSKRIAHIASRFPKSKVTYRTNDFKTNEYAGLIGSELYETPEANPMMGWRGLVRFLHPDNQEVFKWELEAVKRAREENKNIQIMFPMVRDPLELNGTSEEMKRWYGKGYRSAYDIMREVGLERGVDGLETGIMIEDQTNIERLQEYINAGIDFGSIGSNDLTQLVLAVDRDNGKLQLIPIYDEMNSAVISEIRTAIRICKKNGIEIGICGDGPSSKQDLLEALVEEGIDSISLSPDYVFKGYKKTLEVEERLDEAGLAGERVLYEAPKAGENGHVE